MTADEPPISAGERAYRWTRDAILTGRFGVGTFLEEKVVVDQTGVSRTPVREALQRLAGERFLELVPRRGARVRGVTAVEMIETFDLRAVLEGYAIGLLCRHRLPVDDLTAPLLGMEDETRLAAVRAGDRAAIAEQVMLDFEFHFALVKATGNSVLTEAHAGLRSRHQRIGVGVVALRPERFTLFNSQHRALAAAVTEYDDATATGLLREHLRPDAAIVSGLG